MKVKIKEVSNIPNILCYIRIFLIPVFIFYYINAKFTEDYYISVPIILISGITDLLDGFIARKFNQVTEIGKILDPIADKLTQIAIIFSLMCKFKFMVILVVLFIVKESFMGICSLILLRKGRKLDGTMWFGKVSTAIFYTVTVIIIAMPNLNIVIINTLMIIVAIALLVSFLMHIPIFIKMFKNTKAR